MDGPLFGWQSSKTTTYLHAVARLATTAKQPAQTRAASLDMTEKRKVYGRDRTAFISSEGSTLTQVTIGESTDKGGAFQ
ncbi:hypothetical protein BSU04_45440 [Caballeronia sordidicola]|uniref:Uncharacterized protein n=1 Tax=Caballeronia sordidicola TaxID=196367 RepID=A0A226WKQ0_CABSO|nr:hypothetical protein BSU04_45440 [Caballeronia sordidicola]